MLLYIYSLKFRETIHKVANQEWDALDDALDDARVIGVVTYMVKSFDRA